MKIWPFDELAVPSDGMVVLPSELERGSAPLIKIRDAGRAYRYQAEAMA